MAANVAAAQLFSATTLAWRISALGGLCSSSKNLAGLTLDLVACSWEAIALILLISGTARNDERIEPFTSTKDKLFRILEISRGGNGKLGCKGGRNQIQSTALTKKILFEDDRF